LQNVNGGITHGCRKKQRWTTAKHFCNYRDFQRIKKQRRNSKSRIRQIKLDYTTIREVMNWQRSIQYGVATKPNIFQTSIAGIVAFPDISHYLLSSDERCWQIEEIVTPRFPYSR